MRKMANEAMRNEKPNEMPEATLNPVASFIARSLSSSCAVLGSG